MQFTTSEVVVADYLHTVALKSAFKLAHSSIMVLCCDCKACSNQQDLVYHFNMERGGDGGHTQSLLMIFFLTCIFVAVIWAWMGVFLALNAGVNTWRRGPEGVLFRSSLNPGSTARQGAAQIIIKTFPRRKDWMFKRCCTWKDVTPSAATSHKITCTLLLTLQVVL